MALLHNILTPMGATASYWRIASVSGEYPNIQITVVGYASQEYREQDRSLHQLYFQVEPDQTRTEMYAVLKQLPEFVGATDV